MSDLPPCNDELYQRGTTVGVVACIPAESLGDKTGSQKNTSRYISVPGWFADTPNAKENIQKANDWFIHTQKQISNCMSEENLNQRKKCLSHHNVNLKDIWDLDIC